MLEYNEQGKVAVITGGDRGIGRGIATRLAKAGYDLLVTYRSKEDYAASLKPEIEALGRRCELFRADFRRVEDTTAVVPETIKRYGRVDLVVNNAAIMPPRRYQYEYEPEELDAVYSVNYRGYMLLMRDAVRYWIKNGLKGNIVNISSESAFAPHQKFSLYSGIKAAICQSTRSVALDVAAYGIRVNAVVPGLIASKTLEEYRADGVSETEIASTERFKTDVIPLRRAGEVEEIGNAVAWLASDEALYITGQCIIIDGGLTLTGQTNVCPDETEEQYGCLTIKRLTPEDMKNW